MKEAANLVAQFGQCLVVGEGERVSHL
jgi:hypothetical protein